MEELARLLVIKAMARMMRIVTEEGFYMAPGAVAEYIQMTDVFVMCSNYLTAQSRARHQLLWKLTMKHHHLIHIAAHSRYRNPRINWVFLDEDLMGRVSKCCKSAATALGVLRMGPKVVEKYLRQMFVRCRGSEASPWAIGM